MVEHFIPKSLGEALELLDKYNLTIIAGGTDLMVQRRKWANTKPAFESTINIHNINELNYIKRDINNLIIGSTTTLAHILDSDFTPDLLKEAIKTMASPALRNMATIAGNICNASPAGDSLPILYALNAKVVLKDLHEEIKLPINEVILGPRKTILKPNQLIKEIIIPNSTFTKTSFVKVGGRKADAISKLSFTGAVNIKDNIIKDIRIAFGAVAATIVRRIDLEEKILNKTTDELKDLIPNIIEEYSKYVTPIDDQRSNKEYRKQVSLNLLVDFLTNL